MTMSEIRAAFGPDGVADYAPAYGRVGAVTDDTQMTMFTAEGLLRGVCRAGAGGFSHTPSVVYHAYVRWLHTQGERSAKEKFEHHDDGWLIGVGALHSRRAPGATCLAALRGSEMGTIGEPGRSRRAGSTGWSCATRSRSWPRTSSPALATLGCGVKNTPGGDRSRAHRYPAAWSSKSSA